MSRVGNIVHTVRGMLNKELATMETRQPEKQKDVSWLMLAGTIEQNELQYGCDCSFVLASEYPCINSLTLMSMIVMVCHLFSMLQLCFISILTFIQIQGNSCKDIH